MNDYFQHVHNLEGAGFERFEHRTKDAIISLLLKPIDTPNTLERALLDETDQEILDYIGSFVDLKASFDRTILSTARASYVENVDFDHIECIINLRKINHTSRPDDLFRAVNSFLPKGGVYICRVENCYDRKKNFIHRFGKVSGKFLWVLDFLANRVVPRLPVVDRVYKLITRSCIHSFSDAELMGRLAYCGFDIADIRAFKHNTHNRVTYVVAKKSRPPLKKKPSYYPLIKLDRICRDGKQIGIYKFRTMHPYSEFLQDYVIRMNGYDEDGKPANDFRVTYWGRIFRKYHLDELPQIINVLKGNMKIVGVRPLSLTRFREVPPDFKLERIRQKPGCIPPYISLKMNGNHERLEAERIYLSEYKKSPLKTDIRYFLMAIKNSFLAV